MEKVWTKNYVSGVPVEVEVNKFSSLAELLTDSCERFSDKVAFVNMGQSITYKELEKKAQHLASYFKNHLNISKGARIAIMSPNLIQYPIAIYAAFLAGLTVVNVNPLYTPRELKHQLKDSGATAILILENVAHVLAEIIDDTPVQHVILTKVGDCLGFPKSMIVNFVVKHVKKMCPSYHLPTAVSWKKAIAIGQKRTIERVQLEPSDVAFLQYTGGTTGLAKGSVLTHSNVVTNVTQIITWVHDALTEGEEVVFTPLPLYHIFSLTANLFTFLHFGGKIVLITNPRDIPAFVKEFEKYPCSVMSGVNTLYNALLNNPRFQQLDFSTMKIAMAGGMATQRVVAERWQNLTKLPLFEAYGLSETSPAVTVNPLNISSFTGSIGLPISSTEVKVIDENDQELDFDQAGELCVKGPQVMQGYWNLPEETDKVLDKDGWFKTGDIAKIDKQGYVYIVDRKKDLIVVSGFNVYPNEIENVIVAHEKVNEVAAVGVEDEHSGEAVKLYVVRKDDTLTEKELIEYARKQLTGYKIPKQIEFRDDLPKSNVGKILRRLLRETKADST